jgi:hypothetical protein
VLEKIFSINFVLKRARWRVGTAGKAWNLPDCFRPKIAIAISKGKGGIVIKLLKEWHSKKRVR